MKKELVRKVVLNENERDLLCAFHDFLEHMGDQGLLNRKGKRLYHTLWVKIYKEENDDGLQLEDYEVDGK